MGRLSLNNKTVVQVKNSKWWPSQPSSSLISLRLIAIIVLLNSFKDVNSAQLPDSTFSDPRYPNALTSPVAAGLTPGSATLPVNFLQPKDPGDVFHINDALAERLKTANYPTIIEGKIVMKRDPRPPQLNAKLAEAIKSLYNSLQIQIQPPIPIPIPVDD